MPVDHADLFIDGEFIQAFDQQTAETTDPATGAVIATYAVGGAEDLDHAVAAARRSFDEGAWRRMRPHERGRILGRIAEALRERREDIARTVVLDSGKPLRDAYWEVDCTARFFEFYGGLCDKIQGTSIPLGPGLMDWTVKEPIGVSGQIVPWNYPLQVAARSIAPALAIGCSLVVKPSVETPLCLVELTRILVDCGLPPGVFNVVTGPGSVVGDRLVRHDGVDQVTFTGSVEVGTRVMEAAAARAIPTTMELGGKSPQVLFGDADLERSLPIILRGMYTHAGQVCNAGTRLLVERSIHDRAVDWLHDRIRAMTIGPGIDDPDLGPVVSSQQRRQIEAYVDVGRQEGTVLVGASVPDSPALADGYYVPPVLVVDVPATARVVTEEIFGPLLAVVPFDDEEEAFAMANDSEFGLVAGVFTSDIATAMRGAEQLRAGQIWVNGFGVDLDVEFPFGGYKRSGYGREKGIEALGAYVQLKNICVAF